MAALVKKFWHVLANTTLLNELFNMQSSN